MFYAQNICLLTKSSKPLSLVIKLTVITDDFFKKMTYYLFLVIFYEIRVPEKCL
jgi:hypothetical protein